MKNSLRRLSTQGMKFLTTGIFTFYVVCMMANAQEASPWISLNGGEAHPTRILARLNNHNTSTLITADVRSALQESGSVVSRQYPGIPGLVLLDVAVNHNAPRAGYRPGVNKEQQAEDLQARMDVLKQSGFFQYVEPNFIRRISKDAEDPAYVDGRLWGLKNTGESGGVENADIDADLAWDITTGSKDVLVAVIDTGIRYTHQELVANMWVNSGEIPGNGLDDDFNGWVDDIYGINAVNDTGDPLDVEDHGTAVASIIGASADDKDVVGVAWEVQLMACKALGPFGGQDSDLIESIEYAVRMGAHIINASWGGGSYGQGLFDAIALAQENGVLFVAAAGNDGLNNDIFTHFPSNYEIDNIISVAASDRYDLLGDFSNYGVTSVDIAAPGSEIHVAGSGDEAGNIGTGTGSTTVAPDEDYDILDGTSFAAPYVSGVAALIKSVFPDSQAAELKERILSSAVKSSAFLSKVATGGRLNAWNALQVEPDGTLEASVTPPSQSVLLTGSAQPVFVRVTDLIGIPDATVTATSPDGTVTTFANDGAAPDIKAGDAIYSANINLPGNTGEYDMVVRVEAEGKAPVEISLTYTLVPSPSNDDFRLATKVSPSGGRFITNNQFATKEEDEPAHGGFFFSDHSLWWSWSPAVSGPVILDTAGSGFDTILAVYEGNELNSLREVGSVDNSGSRKAGFLNLNVTKGASYRIVVASHDETSSGTIRLRIQPNGTPDLMAPVVKIQSPPSGLISSEQQIVIKGYSFDPEPSASGVQEVQLRVNGEISGGSAKGVSDWETIAYLVPGLNTIQAQAIDFAGNRSEISKVFVSYVVSDPVNDHLKNALVLEGLEGDIEGDSSNATKQFGEPFHAGNAGGRSMWYTYTPEADGQMDIAVRRGRFDTLMAIYTGYKVVDLVAVASNDDATPSSSGSRITQALEAGQQYWIVVDGFGGAGGSFGIRYQYTPTELRELVLIAGEGGVIDGASGLFGIGSEVLLTAVPDAGFQFAGWAGSVDSTDNPLNLVIDSNLEVQAQFLPITVSDNFESGGVSQPFQSEGANWTVTDAESFTGSYSLMSGSIGHGQSTTLSLRQDFSAGRGKFDIKTSTEEGWDVVSFLIDGRLVNEWSGDLEWQRFEFLIDAGQHLLEWQYVKDFSNSEGKDAVFLDNIDLPLEIMSAPQQTASVYVSQGGQGGLDFEIVGQPNQVYILETSKGLDKWQQIYNGRTNHEGRLQVRGVENGGKSQSFFRAVSE
jgi:subtilisin family serine protease